MFRVLLVILVTASATFAQDAFTGRVVQVSFVDDDGGAPVHVLATVDGVGYFAGAVGPISFAGTADGITRTWTFTADSASVSFVWDGYGVGLSLPTASGVLRVSQPGASVPGEVSDTLDAGGAAGLMIFGLLLWRELIASYRRRSLDL